MPESVSKVIEDVIENYKFNYEPFEENFGNDDDYREYNLPYGWKKIGHRRQNDTNRKPWDFFIYSPDGIKFRSTLEVKRFLEENPNVQCDLEVTNTFLPLDLQRSPSKKKLKYSLKRSENSKAEEILENFEDAPAKKFIYSHETGEIFEETKEHPAPCFECHFPKNSAGSKI